jgi:ubiquinone/menaquinone biosynthesis C-methylase UbiE
MSENLNPQAEQMADESMVRTLAAQADCIWPQEAELFDRYSLPAAPRILDGGCGTGEISSRLAERYSGATVLGVDVLDIHLEAARRRRPPGAAARLRKPQHLRSRPAGRQLRPGGLPPRAAVDPYPERALAELARVPGRGGRLHLIAGDTA